jgi:WD40 repeat protein
MLPFDDTEQLQPQPKLSIKVPDNVCRMRVSPSADTFVTGGNEHLLQLWDINQGKRTWISRNVGLPLITISPEGFAS